jgi:ribosomal protein L3 glutamine methyltransferase
MLDKTESFETDHLNTLKDFMRWGASQFMRAELTFAHGMPTAIDEAVYLVLRCLHLPVDTPEVYWDGQLTDKEKEMVSHILRQRIETRKPAAYLMHEGWFAGLPFYINESVLVPRSPIAELIEQQFHPWVDVENTFSILDLCTGSGCIGIACAYAFPEAEIDISDISTDALEVAEVNIERHDVASRVTAIQSDLFKELQGKKYDLIVSNPPYVDAEDMMALSQEFTHEPAMALASGKDGLDITRQILATADDFLNPNGVLIVEVGNSQFALQESMPDVPFQWLEFENGGDGVFLLMADQLGACPRTRIVTKITEIL